MNKVDLLKRRDQAWARAVTWHNGQLHVKCKLAFQEFIDLCFQIEG